MPASRGVKRPIPAEKITLWIINNKVLSIALGGVCACMHVRPSVCVGVIYVCMTYNVILYTV